MTIYLSQTDDEDEFCRVTQLNDHEEVFELSAWYGQIRDRWISLRQLKLPSGTVNFLNP